MSHGLPDPPDEPEADTSLENLAPAFAAKVAAMMMDLAADGFPSRIAEAFRSDERQEWLFGMGRDYDDGRGVVTQAQTGLHSWHRYGLAVDVVHATKGWNAPAQYWRALGDAAERNGLAWGGRWRQKDLPHVQFGPPMRVSPSQHAMDLLADEGVEAVWEEVGAI